MSIFNPWRGLASYNDPKDSDKEYIFAGREQESALLARIIENSLFVTLYGRTGIGKTSILNAGVFPILRDNGFIPLYIRLSGLPADSTYSQAIIRLVENCHEFKSHKVIDTGAQAESEGLLYYFASHRFYDADNQEVYPVIVFDQFEETFFSAHDKTRALLREIYELIAGEHTMPEGYNQDTNYRFVASIREDNLYLFEDDIDDMSLTEYKESRYRLRPFNSKNAYNAIIEPGGQFIEKNDADNIAGRIIEMSRDNDGSISSLILSLICSLAFERAAKRDPLHPVIRLSDIPDSADDTDRLLGEFYQRCTNSKQRRIIEEYLLTDDGHRRTAKVKIPDVEKLLSPSCRILHETEAENDNGGKEYEIIHDRLAKVIYQQRRHRDSNRFDILLRLVVIASLAGIFWWAITLSWTSTNGYKFDHAENKPHITSTVTTDSIYFNSDTVYTVYVDGGKNTIVSLGPDVKKIYGGDEYFNRLYVSNDNPYFVVDTILAGYNPVYCVIDKRTDSICFFTDYPSSPRRLSKKFDKLKYEHSELHTSYGLKDYGEETVEITNRTYSSVDYKNDDKIKKVILNNVDNISDNAFSGCTALEEINLEDVKSIGSNAFRNCYNLKRIKLRDSVTIYSDAFDNCINLDSVVIPRHARIYSDAFQNCIGLKYLSLPDFIYSIVNTSFSLCANIEEIVMPENNKVEIYDSYLVTSGNNRIFPHKFLKDGDKYHVIKDVSVYDELFRDVTAAEGYVPYYADFNENGIYGAKTNSKGRPVSYYITDSCRNFSINEELPKSGSKFYLWIRGNPVNLKEIHLNSPDPHLVEITLGSNFDKGKITLFVPHGSVLAYSRSGKYDDFAAIKEDPLSRKVLYTLHRWYESSIGYFRTNDMALLLSILGLACICFVFYLWSLRTLSRDIPVGWKKHLSALCSGLIGMIVAFIGFIPVYWLTFTFICQHTDIFDAYNMYIGSIILSSVAGAVSAAMCAWLFVFSARGKWVNKISRKLSGK